MAAPAEGPQTFHPITPPLPSPSPEESPLSSIPAAASAIAGIGRQAAQPWKPSLSIEMESGDEGQPAGGFRPGPLLVDEDLSGTPEITGIFEGEVHSKYNSEFETIVKSIGDEPAARALQQRLGARDCRLGRRLGSGRFGSVYELTGGAEGEPRVLKIYNLQRLRDVGSSRYRQEGGHSLLIPNPRVKSPVNLLIWHDGQILTRDEAIQRGVGPNMELLASFMPRASGRNLSSLLVENALDPKQKIQVAFQLAETLSELHSDHILHRDLKPENIVVNIDEGRSCETYLIDVDQAKRIDPHSGTRSPVGTQGYHSPERLFAETTPYGAESDAWAYGVTLYQMAYGRLPYDSPRDIQEEGFKISFLESSLPPPFLDVIRGLLAIHPQQRMSTREALVRLRSLI